MAFHLHRQRAVFVQNPTGVFALPAAMMHSPSAQVLLEGDVVDPELSEIVAEHMDGGDFVHAGAGIGLMLPDLCGAAPASAQIWAFEPDPLAVAFAGITVRLNRLSHVVLRPVALADWPGPKLMQTVDPAGRPLPSGGRIVGGPMPGMVEVHADRLDALIPSGRRVGLIHLDLGGGMEMAALLGASGILERDRPLVVLRASRTDAALDCCQGWERLGGHGPFELVRPMAGLHCRRDAPLVGMSGRK